MAVVLKYRSLIFTGQSTDSLKRGGGGGGRARKKRRGDWGEMEGNACYNNPVLFTSAEAGVCKFCLVNQTMEQACSANQTGYFS